MQRMLAESYKNKLIQMTYESRRQDLVNQACSRYGGRCLGLAVPRSGPCPSSGPAVTPPHPAARATAGVQQDSFVTARDNAI